MIFTNPKRRPHNEPIYTKKLLLDHLLHHPCNPIISAAIMIENYQNRTLYGNALDVLKALPGGIAQTCVTSPPYYGLRNYNHNEQIGLEPTAELYVERLTAVFDEVNRVLKDSGTLWLNIGDSYAGSNSGKKKDNKAAKNSDLQAQLNIHRPSKKQDGLKPKNLIGIPWRVAFALQRAGWYLRSEIIWHKPNCMPESVKDRPTNAHEKIFLLSKSKRYYYDHEAIMEPLAKSTAKDSRLVNNDFTNRRPQRGYPNGQPQNGSGLLKGYGKKRNKRTVWNVPLVPYSEDHFAVYPPALIVPCIKAGSAKGDLVLDPFIGTGTTAEVALRLGRKYLGIDLQQDNETLQQKRLQPLTNDLFINAE